MSGPLPADAPDLAGTQYVLERLLGQGGFAQAWLATNRALRRRCVLKVLVDTSHAGFVARFHREARVMANLDHPAIPRIYEVATTRGGRPYFAMEVVDGKSFGDLLVDAGGALPLHEACRMVADAAEGLAAAHAIGVVHRDVKLANLLMSQRGEVKIIDFGIAKKTITDADATTGISTAVNQLLGTPRYMSPEQARAQSVGPASDLYSLGVVLFLLLTGRSPFDGTAHEILLAHVSQPPPKLATIARTPFPGSIEAIVAQLLEKEPERRFRDGHALAYALRTAAAVRSAPSFIAAAPEVAAHMAARDVETPQQLSAVANVGMSRRTDHRLAAALPSALLIEPSVPLMAVTEAEVAGTQMVATRALDLTPPGTPPPMHVGETDIALLPMTVAPRVPEPDPLAATELATPIYVAPAPPTPQRVIIRPPIQTVEAPWSGESRPPRARSAPPAAATVILPSRASPRRRIIAALLIVLALAAGVTLAYRMRKGATVTPSSAQPR